jgi:hypothetical protein
MVSTGPNMSDDEVFSGNQPTGRKLALMRSLASSLQHAQTAIVRSDLQQLQRQTAEQDRLCQQLRRLDLPRPEVNQPSVLPGPVAADEPGDDLARELVRVELQVMELNREYGALLRRARRTVEAFCRVIAASEITYLPPKPTATVSTATSGSK